MERMAVRERFGLTAFFILLFSISWVGALPMVLVSHKIAVPQPMRILQVLMLFGPGIAAVIASGMNDGKEGVKRLLKGLIKWRVNPVMYIAVLSGPPLIYAVSLILSNAAGFSSLALPAAAKFLTTFATVVGVYLLLNTEELAWRGYALPRLEKKFGVAKATVIIGILWAVFHLPLFLVKGGHPAGYPIWLYAFMIAAFVFPFTALYNATGGSILLPHLLHQTLNASVEAIPVYPVAAKTLAPIAISIVLMSVVSLALSKWKAAYQIPANGSGQGIPVIDMDPKQSGHVPGS